MFYHVVTKKRKEKEKEEEKRKGTRGKGCLQFELNFNIISEHFRNILKLIFLTKEYLKSRDI